MQNFLRHSFLPKTVEQAIGATMLLTAVIMIGRPYASALTDLYAAYSILISPRFLGALFALCGGLLIGLRRTSRKRFFVLWLPMLFYALALWANFARVPNLGPIGQIGVTGFWLSTLWLHALIVTLRERALL